jgi:hypothetical protein
VHGTCICAMTTSNQPFCADFPTDQCAAYCPCETDINCPQGYRCAMDFVCTSTGGICVPECTGQAQPLTYTCG